MIQGVGHQRLKFPARLCIYVYVRSHLSMGMLVSTCIDLNANYVTS
jgi:hypothetical protein